MKKIYLLLLIATSTMNLYCQANWTKHAGNPIMVAGPEEWEDTYIGPGSVIFHEGEYHMWYSAGHFPGAGNEDFKIGHATSLDGINWTKDKNPVLDKGAEGEWDSRGVFYPSVLLRDDVFHMWFTGYSSDGNFYSIGHATSADGIIWTKHANNPVLGTGNPDEWDGDRLKAPSVVFDGSVYHMFYDAFANNEGNSIGHATSADGISWSKDSQNPVIKFGGTGSWDDDLVELQSVVFYNDTFHMWYSGGQRFLEWDIGYATSDDGSTWFKDENNPVLLKGEAGSWESQLISTPSVIYDSINNIFKMWYHGQKDNDSGGIGYAETTPVSVFKRKAEIHVRLYPNPTRDQLNITTPETGKYRVAVSSVSGQFILEKEFEAGTLQLNLSNVKEGIYFVTIRSKAGVVTRKIIKL